MSDSVSRRKGRVAEHIAVLPKSGIRDFFELVSSLDDPDVISLGVGEPDFATPWSVREASIYGLERGHTSYTSNLGLLSLRRAVCNYVADEFGIDADPVRQCIITVGVSEGLDLILRALLNPGDEVLYHEPCYVSYSPGIAMAHGVPVAVPTHEENEFALDVADIAARITPRTRVLLLNFPCNPTGANLTLEQKQQIAALACKHDLIVLTDEIYAELTYAERSPCIATLPGMASRTVLLAGFSKAFAMTGYRVAYAVGPEDLIDAMMKIHQYTMLCAPINAQEAAIEALRKTGLRARDEMYQAYFQRRNVIVRRFREMGLPCVLPKGAFYAYPNIADSGLPAIEFSRRLLEEEKVAVVPGTAFCPGDATHVRCAYATSMENIETAMDRIARFLGRVRSAAPAALAGVETG